MSAAEIEGTYPVGLRRLHLGVAGCNGMFGAQPATGLGVGPIAMCVVACVKEDAAVLVVPNCDYHGDDYDWWEGGGGRRRRKQPRG